MQPISVEVAQVLLELVHWIKCGMYQKVVVMVMMVRHLTLLIEQ